MTKWHDWKPAWKAMARADAAHAGTTHIESFAELHARMLRVIKRVSGAARVAMTNSLAHMTGEYHWENDRRPYYDVYPSVAQALTTIDLDKVLCDHIRLPIPVLLIRFQVGHELEGGHSKIRSILAVHSAADTDRSKTGIVLCIDTGEIVEGTQDINHSTTAMILETGTTIQSRLELGREPGRSLDQEVDNGAMDAAYRLVCSLCLLRDNPDLINPEPLEADRAKWEASHDPKFIAKAERRGKRAWSVGKHIETAPGFRRPHFAIRWMGRGQAVKLPVVRPIRGCLVLRKQVEEIPTGYLDDVSEAPA